MSDMVKCIGGPMDGKYVKHGGSLMAAYPESEPLPCDFAFAGSQVCIQPGPTLYKLRSVRCEGSEIWYYAPEDWTDLRALQQVLA